MLLAGLLHVLEAWLRRYWSRRTFLERGCAARRRRPRLARGSPGCRRRLSAAAAPRPGPGRLWTDGRQRLARNDLLLGQLLLHPLRRLLVLEGLLGRFAHPGARSSWRHPGGGPGAERLCARELLLAQAALGAAGPLSGGVSTLLPAGGAPGGGVGFSTFGAGPFSSAFRRRRPLLALLLLALGLLLLGERRLRLSEHERVRLPGRLGVRDARKCNGKGKSAEEGRVVEGVMVVPGKPFVQARGGRRAYASAGRARPFVTPVWGTMEAASASAHWPIRPGHAPPARQLRHAAGACSQFSLTLPVLARWDQATQTGMRPMNQVEILEVAPRDGFQAVKPFIPTETKIALIEELAACGFKRLEIGSFVSPKAIPQLADTGEILRRARLPKGLRIQVLVPNAKGLEMALAAGVREIIWVISVSESHNRANVNRSVDESFAPSRRRGPGSAATSRSCGWRCRPASTAPGRAASPRTSVIRLVERTIAAAPEVEIAICDTTGRASPDHVGSLFGRLIPRYASPSVTLRLSRPRHLWPRRRQRHRGLSPGRAHHRRSGGRARRLPVRARRRRQHGERGFGVRLRAHGHCHRHRLRPSC